MGRYSQARRRGGGGPVPVAAPSLVSVVLDSSFVVNLLFDGPVAIAGAVPAGAFQINDTDPDTVTVIDAQTLAASYHSVINVGDAWQLNDSTWLSPAGVPLTGGLVL